MLQKFCFILGGAGLLYFLVIILYAGLQADFAWFWLVAGSILLLDGLRLKLTGRFLWQCGIAGKAAVMFCAAAFLLFTVLCSRVISGMYYSAPDNLEYVVVLGAQVRGEIPSLSLRYRLDRAAEYARENPETVFILSGGQGSGEYISEAECMYRYMTEHGVEKSRLVKEDRSESTVQNLLYSNELTGCADAKTGIISNNFHIYRALKIARKQGYQTVSGVPARTGAILVTHFVVREVFALMNEWRRGTI